MKNTKAIIAKYIQYFKERSKELNKDKNALVFGFFLFLATCFWILNALSKDNYTTDLKYPIRLVNDNKNEVIQGELRRDLTIKVRGGGFSILNYHLNEKFLTQSIDVSKLPRVNVNGHEGVIVSTNEYLTRIEGRLATGMTLVELTPDTLFVPLVEKVSKKLPINLDADISYAKQFQLAGGVSLRPDSVLVSGPRNMMDTINEVRTKKQAFKELKDTLIRNVALTEYKWLSYDSKRVVVTIPVESFTEAIVMVPIAANGLPSTLQLKSFPPQVKVDYRLGLTKKLFKPSDFAFAIDFSEVDLNNPPRRVKVSMLKKPAELGYVDYEPLFVEFLLEKKGK